MSALARTADQGRTLRHIRKVPLAEVKRSRGHLTISSKKLMLDEISDYRHRAFGCIGDYGVPAVRKSFELNEVRRQSRCNIGLALDRMHRIVLAAQHEGRALNAMEIGEHVEAVALPARPCEPAQPHLRLSDRTASDVRIAWRPRVNWEGKFSPSVDRGLISPIINVQEPAARERAHLGAAEALEQRHPSIKVGVSGGLGADQHQLRRVIWMACGISKRDHAAE
jgi:hypothetical protein